MIYIIGSMYQYVGRITTPTLDEVECCMCGITKSKYAGTKSINMQGWYAVKHNGRTIRRYCPACGEDRIRGMTGFRI